MLRSPTRARTSTSENETRIRAVVNASLCRGTGSERRRRYPRLHRQFERLVESHSFPLHAKVDTKAFPSAEVREISRQASDQATFATSFRCSINDGIGGGGDLYSRGDS